MALDYFIGLDLGQARDYSALAVLERTRTPDLACPERSIRTYAVRHLERWPLKTSYPQIVEDVITLSGREPLRGPTPLCLDATGVGRAITDLFRKARLAGRLPALPVPITFTAAHAVRPEENGFHVPKRDLVGVTLMLLQTRRLAIAPALALAKTLAKELETFETKISLSGHESFEAGSPWREGSHDDLLFAVALPAWFAETRRPEPFVFPKPTVKNSSIVNQLPYGVFLPDRDRPW